MVLKVPKPTRDKNNNPNWVVQLPVRVERMDNTLAMTEYGGVLREGQTEVGDWSRAFSDHPVFVVAIKRGKRDSLRLAIDCEPIILAVVDQYRVFEESKAAPRQPHPKSIKSKRGR